MKIFKRVVLKLIPLCFWLMIMLSFDDFSICALTLSAVALHELSHIGAYILIKNEKIAPLRAVLIGLKLYTGGGLSYSEELIITLAGPLANLLAFLLSLPFYGGSGYIFTFGLINLFCAISNLVPIRGYDGYGILSALLSLKSSIPRDDILSLISLLFSATAAILSALVIFIIGEGYWIFIVFFVQLLKEIIKLHS